jgi:hypothetical protein
MTYKIAYSYNENQEFCGECQAWQSPLEKDVFLLPANATFIKPLPHKKNNKIIFNGESWIYKELPKPEPKPEPEKPELTYEQKRLAEYGDVAKQIEYITENGLVAWKKKVEAIKAKYPKN